MRTTLRHERKAKGWTQNYVANQIGISPEAISMLETGQHKPSYDVLVKLENLFQKGHRELFGATSPDVEKQNSNPEKETTTKV